MEDDAVSPVHYQRGPIECIELCSAISDFRLASAMKYLYRISFGGKMGEDTKQDAAKAIWYLQHFIEKDLP